MNYKIMKKKYKLYRGNGLTQTEIANRLNCSQQMISLLGKLLREEFLAKEANK